MEATPIDVVQKQRARIIATMNHEAEQQKEMERKHEAQQREYERQKARYR